MDTDNTIDIEVVWNQIRRQYKLNAAQVRIVRQARTRFEAEAFKHGTDEFSRYVHQYGVKYTESRADYVETFYVRVADVPTVTLKALVARGVIEVIDLRKGPGSVGTDIAYRVPAAIIAATPWEREDPVLSALFRTTADPRFRGDVGYKYRSEAETALWKAAQPPESPKPSPAVTS